MYLEKISLSNPRMRISLKQGDSQSVLVSRLRLLDKNFLEAEKLMDWFIGISTACSNSNSKLTMELALMRMWQLGRIDIKDVSMKESQFSCLLFLGLDLLEIRQEVNGLRPFVWK